MPSRPKKKRKKSPEVILKELGLNVDEVRSAFNVAPPVKTKPKKNYLYSYGQKKIRKRVKDYEGMMFSRFVQGMSPATIANILSVSEETVRLRLRKAGFFSSQT